MTMGEKVYKALGFISGTSVDGIDCAIIETDGKEHVKPLYGAGFPYPVALRAHLLGALGSMEYTPDLKAIEREMTLVHVDLIKKVIQKSGVRPDIIGFHGQTLSHHPALGRSFQLGDGKLLARETGINVVNDFRTADIKSGGQGAPFLPIYHKALFDTVKKKGTEEDRARGQDSPVERDGFCEKWPVVVLNLGGVANVTWIGEREEQICAFDTGPASALIDDLMRARTDQSYDEDGRTAQKGKVEEKRLAQWLEHPYFQTLPPKSLDRDEWKACDCSDLSLEDAAATLTEFTVRSIAAAEKHFPEQALAWYVSGGGRHNRFLMKRLRMILSCARVESIDALGWNGDFLEAEGFAYLAVRSIKELPLSVPGTTGCSHPCPGGVLHVARSGGEGSFSGTQVQSG